MGKYNFGDKASKPDWHKIKFRLNPIPRQVSRFPTGMADLDGVLGGGLPYGLTIFYGVYGSGKSKLAREIAKKNKTLFVCSEDSRDAPPHSEYPNVDVLEYVTWKPQANKAIDELLLAIEKIEPDLVVIDSLTTFLSLTAKAVPEADVREYTFKLGQQVSGKIPVIGVSEIRGSGQYRNFAGGSAIGHAPMLLVEFDKIEITNWNAKKFDEAEGSFVWTWKVMKDRDGVAHQGNVYKVNYLLDEPQFEKVEYDYE